MNKVIHGDNLDVITSLEDSSFQLIYIDPPFNTGKTQTRKTLKSVADEAGTRTGFQGRKYSDTVVSGPSYADTFDDFCVFIEPRLREAHRLLNDTGTLYVHLDWREVHYVKVMLDGIFGRDNFLNEIVWAYDFGGRAKDRFPQKHDTILVYVKNVKKHFFDQDAVDRIPYMAPGLVTPEKVAKGKLPTDVWWHTIVPTNGKEKTGYPTQKPLGILDRIIKASSREGDWVLDFFAGSGTTGQAALNNNRNFVLVDSSLDSIKTIHKRLGTDNTGYVFYVYQNEE